MSEAIKDGGPAFPRVPISGDADKYSGMSLRDYFAGQALQVVTRGEHVDGFNDLGRHTKSAYEYADAMLKARVTR